MHLAAMLIIRDKQETLTDPRLRHRQQALLLGQLRRAGRRARRAERKLAALRQHQEHLRARIW